MLVMSTLNPGGTLSFVNTYHLQDPGRSYTFMNYNARNGAFPNVQLPPLPLPLAWNLDYGSNTLTLEVITASNSLGGAATLANGAFQFNMSGTPAASCVIEASTNLANWTPIQTNVPFTGSVDVVDPGATNFARRFYRGRIGN
jgi:hypothetical protein